MGPKTTENSSHGQIILINTKSCGSRRMLTEQNRSDVLLRPAQAAIRHHTAAGGRRKEGSGLTARLTTHHSQVGNFRRPLLGRTHRPLSPGNVDGAHNQYNAPLLLCKDELDRRAHGRSATRQFSKILKYSARRSVKIKNSNRRRIMFRQRLGVPVLPPRLP